MAQITLIKSGSQVFDLFQSRLKSELDPVLSNQLIQGNLLTNIQLSGSSPMIIDHKLSRMMVGWMISDMNAQANVWRSQPLNQTTLTLSASANVVVNLWVF